MVLSLSNSQILQIVKDYTGLKNDGIWEIHNTIPTSWTIYGAKKYENKCWIVHCAGEEPSGILHSSRALFISKETGKVVYEASVGDEG